MRPAPAQVTKESGKRLRCMKLLVLNVKDEKEQRGGGKGNLSGTTPAGLAREVEALTGELDRPGMTDEEGRRRRRLG